MSIGIVRDCSKCEKKGSRNPFEGTQGGRLWEGSYGRATVLDPCPVNEIQEDKYPGRDREEIGMGRGTQFLEYPGSPRQGDLGGTPRSLRVQRTGSQGFT